MNKQKIIYKLRTEPGFLSDTIVYNNPEAVSQKLERHTDYVAETADQLAEYVKDLIREGQLTIVNDVLQVPFSEENATERLNDVYEQLVAERNQSPAGKFEDINGGLFVLALEPHEVNDKTIKNINPQLKSKGCGCNCGCGKKLSLCSIKETVKNNKTLIIIGLVVAVLIYLKYNKKI